jgi:hypothetical protein
MMFRELIKAAKNYDNENVDSPFLSRNAINESLLKTQIKYEAKDVKYMMPKRVRDEIHSDTGKSSRGYCLKRALPRNRK